MRRINRLALLCASVLVLLSFPVTAWADPGEDHGHDDIPVPAPSLPNFGPSMKNMELLDVADKDGTIIPTSPSTAILRSSGTTTAPCHQHPPARPPRLVSDTRCRANQGDLSVFMHATPPDPVQSIAVP